MKNKHCTKAGPGRRHFDPSLPLQRGKLVDEGRRVLVHPRRRDKFLWPRKWQRILRGQGVAE